MCVSVCLFVCLCVTMCLVLHVYVGAEPLIQTGILTVERHSNFYF